MTSSWGRRGNHRKGENHGLAVLTENQVREPSTRLYEALSASAFSGGRVGLRRAILCSNEEGFVVRNSIVGLDRDAVRGRVRDICAMGGYASRSAGRVYRWCL